MGNIKLVLAAATVAVLSTPAFAGTNLVQNGSFELDPTGQVGFSTTVTGWSVTKDNPAQSDEHAFIFSNSTAYSTGVGPTTFGYPAKLWPGLPTPDTQVDGGTQFFGVDSLYNNVVLSQVINGLTPGKTYALTFDWAAGQFFGFSGATEDYWQVSLGNETYSTATAAVASHGFEGWFTATMHFTPTSSSETLSFNDVGCVVTANGCGSSPVTAPPFSLLDSVTMAVPEPSTWAMMALGFAGLGYAGFRRGRRDAISIV